MAVDEAVILLLKTIGTDDPSSEMSRRTAKNIVTTLGNLALAITQAGAVIRQNICRIEDYCDMYQRRRRELLSRAPIQASSDYKYTVYTTWEVSVNIIEGMSSEVASHALELLRLFSFLHFDGISEEIFRQIWVNTAGEPSSDWTASNHVSWLHEDTSSEWDPYRVRESVSLLLSFSLIKVNGSTNNISMHPLVHTWARDRLGMAEQKKWLLITALMLAASVSWEGRTSDYRFRRSLVSHVTSCLTSLTPGTLFALGKGEHERLEIARKFIRVLNENGQWQDAVELEEKVLKACKRTLGDEHPSTILSMNNLAWSYNNLGRPQDAVQLREKVLEACKRTLGDEHPNTLLSISNLAASYSDLGRSQDAVELEEKVLEARKRTLGDEHPATLLSMGNLAMIYSNLGRLQDAVELEEKALEAHRRTLGEEHPDTLLLMGNLAMSHSNLGRLQDAIELGEKVLEARKRTLGEEHPDTLLSIYNLEFYLTSLYKQTQP